MFVSITRHQLKHVTAVNQLIALWMVIMLKIIRGLPSHIDNGGQKASRDLCRSY